MDWIDAYEREHGVKPPGMRGTGAPWWFAPRHPERGPCALCGTDTGRWIVVRLRVGMIPDPGGTKHRGMIGEYVAECQGCADAETITVLEQRQNNPALLETVKREEAELLETLRRRTRQPRNFCFRGPTEGGTTT